MLLRSAQDDNRRPVFRVPPFRPSAVPPYLTSFLYRIRCGWSAATPFRRLRSAA